MVAPFLMRWQVRIGHQYVETGAGRIVARRRTDRAAANDDQIVFHVVLHQVVIGRVNNREALYKTGNK
jgi:hypothetical protein